MAKKINLPTISVAVATFNSSKTLDRCLKLLGAQDYPQNKIEIVLGDGGSSDNTFEIAKKYKARIVSIPTERQGAEYNRGVAYKNCINELVLILDHDNYLPSKNWLRQMVEPFLENQDLIASSSCYYHYDKKFGLMDRYFALFGTSEPLPYYLKKADRLRWVDKEWNLAGDAEDKGDYFLVSFEKDPRKFPSVGTNGCLMRKALVDKYADTRPAYHYPIDVLFDVVKNKKTNKFAFVKNSIIHLTNERGFIAFIKRRFRFVKTYHFKDRSKRRWSVVMPGDSWGVFGYVLQSLTLIIPVFEAVRGFVVLPDVAWFVYPPMCLITAVMYGPITIKSWFANK